jgi:hypothetical protein
MLRLRNTACSYMTNPYFLRTYGSLMAFMMIAMEILNSRQILFPSSSRSNLLDLVAVTGGISSLASFGLAERQDGYLLKFCKSVFFRQPRAENAQLLNNNNAANNAPTPTPNV